MRAKRIQSLSFLCAILINKESTRGLVAVTDVTVMTDARDLIDLLGSDQQGLLHSGLQPLWTVVCAFDILALAESKRGEAARA